MGYVNQSEKLEMSKIILVDHIYPSNTKAINIKEIGVMLYNKMLMNYSIIVKSGDTTNIISPHTITGGLQELQRTVELLAKSIESTYDFDDEIEFVDVNRSTEATFAIFDIVPEHKTKRLNQAKKCNDGFYDKDFIRQNR